MKQKNKLYVILAIVIVFILLLIKVDRVGAISTCGAVPSGVLVLDKTLTGLNVPHSMGLVMKPSRMTCWQNGSPHPCPKECDYWYIELKSSSTVMRITFSMSGLFRGIR